MIPFLTPPTVDSKRDQTPSIPDLCFLITPFILGSMPVGLNTLDHSSFVYGFMSLDYGLGTMTATIIICDVVKGRTSNPYRSLGTT